MRSKNLLVLTALVALMGAFIFFYERKLPSTDERVSEEKKVLKLDKDEVEALVIDRGGERVRLERVPPEKKNDEGDDGDVEDELADTFGTPAKASWQITEPFTARADATSIDSLLGTLADLEKKRTLEDVDRAELGLDAPRATLTIVREEGETTLEIGAEIPPADDMIVAVAGRDEAYPVARALYTALDKPAGDWRDKALFTAGREAIERLTLHRGEASVQLAKRGETFWIENPLQDRADADAVSGLLGEITGLKVEGFLDDEGGRAFGAEAATLEVVLAGRETPFRITLEPDPDDEGLAVARVDGQWLTTRNALLESFDKGADDWRSRAWTPLQVYAIDAITIEDGADSLTLERAEGDWQRGDERIAFGTVSDLLYAIADAKAETIVDRTTATARGHDLVAPALTVMLTGDEGQATDTLQLYPTAEEGLAAATAAGRDAVLLLAGETAAEIQDKLEAVRAAEPLPAEPASEGDAATEEGTDDDGA